MATGNNGLSDTFARFAGREVKVTEKDVKFDIGGRTIETVDYKLSAKDPVIGELKKEAAKAGFSLRVWLPNTVGTMDHRMNRLNVKIGKADDGAYRINRIYRG